MGLWTACSGCAAPASPCAAPAPAQHDSTPCTWSAPWQASASASAPAPGRHQALTQQQAQQHALELREQMPSVLRPSKRHTPALALWFASQTMGSLSLLLVVLLVLFGFFGLLHREIQCPIEESNRTFLLCTARICSVIWYGAARHIDVPMARIAGPSPRPHPTTD